METKTYEMYTESQILYGVTVAYILYCTNHSHPKLNNRNMTKDFYILRNFFKRDKVNLRKLSEYATRLAEKGEKRIMSVGDFYKRAEAYYQWQRSEVEKKIAQEILKDVEIPVQRKFTLADLMKL